MIELTLPWPPSVNHYWMRNKNGSMRICQAGIDFRNATSGNALLSGITPGKVLFTGHVHVSITAFPPDRRKRDVDNILKCVLDALGKAGVYTDDSNVWKLTIQKMDPVDKNGSLIVRIESC